MVNVSALEFYYIYTFEFFYVVFILQCTRKGGQNENIH